MRLLPFALRVERAQRLGCPAAHRADLGAIVVVRDLAGPVVELELLQCRQRAVTLLGQRYPLPLRLGRLVQAVVSRPGVAQERRGDEQHARDREQRAEREPHQLFECAGAYLDGHFVTSVFALATKVPCA
jgi:hypothetical protein